MYKETSFMKILEIVKRRAKQFWLVLLVLLTFSLGLVFLSNNSYPSANARLLIGVETEEATGEYNELTGEPIYEEVIKYQQSSISEESIAFYTEIIKNTGLIEDLIDKLDLDYSVSELKQSISIMTPEKSTTIVVRLGSSTIDNPKEILEELIPMFKNQVMEITEMDKIKVLNVTNEPTVVYSSKFMRNVLASIIISVFLSGLLLLTIEYLDDTIHTVSDIEEGLSIFVLGVLQSKETMAEDLKLIRTNINYSNQLKNKGLLTFSGVENDYDDIIINLFREFDLNNQDTLLIDANLRDPQIDKKLNISNELGLTNVLSSKLKIEDALQSVENYQNKVLTSGNMLDNPSEQLSSIQMKELLKELEKTFKLVIVNSYPMYNVTDSIVLSTATDGVILFVNKDKTKATDLLELKNKLANVNVELLGIIFNKI